MEEREQEEDFQYPVICQWKYRNADGSGIGGAEQQIVAERAFRHTTRRSTLLIMAHTFRPTATTLLHQSDDRFFSPPVPDTNSGHAKTEPRAIRLASCCSRFENFAGPIGCVRFADFLLVAKHRESGFEGGQFDCEEQKEQFAQCNHHCHQIGSIDECRQQIIQEKCSGKNKLLR